MSKRTLVEQLKFWRAERPDEWTMDELIRDAKELEAKVEKYEARMLRMATCAGDFAREACRITDIRADIATSTPNAALMDALKRIELGECETMDEDLGQMVLVCMSSEEMVEIARAALASVGEPP